MECIPTVSTHRSLFFGQVDHTRQLDFSKCDITALAADMNLVDWSSVFSFSYSIDIAWRNFALKFKALIEKHTPFKVIYAKRSRALYLHFSILRLIRLKKSAWKRFTRTRSNSD